VAYDSRERLLIIKLKTQVDTHTSSEAPPPKLLDVHCQSNDSNKGWASCLKQQYGRTHSPNKSHHTGKHLYFQRKPYIFPGLLSNIPNVSVSSTKLVSISGVGETRTVSQPSVTRCCNSNSTKPNPTAGGLIPNHPVSSPVGWISNFRLSAAAGNQHTETSSAGVYGAAVRCPPSKVTH